MVRPGPGGQGTFSVLCDNFHVEIEMSIGPKLLSRYRTAWHANVLFSVIFTVVPQPLSTFPLQFHFWLFLSL